jgi:formylglycine-generating enzyme required for sulfatase activity
VRALSGWSALRRAPLTALLATLFLVEGCGARSSLDAAAEELGQGGHATGDHGAAGTGGHGAPGQGGSGGAPLPPGCLADLPGPKLVKVDLSDRSFCMDATEVTNADYAAWLETGPDPAAQPAACAWNESFEPWDQVWPVPSDHMDHPVTGVDFCDAEAYCRLASKRLCRPEEWVSACTHDGERVFPYGDSFIPSACNGNELGIDGSLPAGALTSCEGGFPGLFNLAGNVTEWVDECDGTGEHNYCTVLGGWWFDHEVSCSTRFAFARHIGGVFMGFRCCRY